MSDTLETEELEPTQVESDGSKGDIADKPASRWHGKRWWIDVLLLIVLFAAACPVRYAQTRGDLWMDEAEYTLSSTHPYADHRWDRSDVPDEPERLKRLRHYHPPMTAYLLRTAQVWGNDERTLRSPFVVAGSLVVCMVYLCGLRLFKGRRIVSLACAVVVIFTPMQIRASSHAIPWSLISLGLMSVLWTLLGWIETGRKAWLLGTCGVLGWLFCTTESFFPISLALLLSLPFVFGPKAFTRIRAVMQTPPTRKRLLTLGVQGALIFLLITFVFWPVGLLGSALGNIRHYSHLPINTVSAVVGDVVYCPIPRWAFLYWYSHDFKPYFALYVLGVGTLLAQIVCWRLSRGAGLLLILTVVETSVAHMTVEFGPEYMAHCLPLLTLMAGFFFCALSQGFERVSQWGIGRIGKPAWSLQVVVPILLTLICLYLSQWQIRTKLLNTDIEAKVTRWPAAARFLAARWRPGDKLIIGPQPLVVPRWYLLHIAGVSSEERSITDIPQPARLPTLERIARGDVRFAVVNSTFASNPKIDAKVHKMLQSWPVIYRSPEPFHITPRIIIYERPAGVDSEHPLPIPQQ